MVTLSSCLLWHIISFVLPPNEYGYVYAWTTLKNIAILLFTKHLVSTWRCYVRHSRSYPRCFVSCFWRSNHQPQSWPPRRCDLTPLDYYLWGADKAKCCAYKPDTIDALEDNIDEIQLHTNDNVLKNWTDRVGHCMTSRGSQLNEIIFKLLTGRIVLSNKKRNFRKYSAVFFKVFSKKRHLAEAIFLWWLPLNS